MSLPSARPGMQNRQQAMRIAVAGFAMTMVVFSIIVAVIIPETSEASPLTIALPLGLAVVFGLAARVLARAVPRVGAQQRDPEQVKQLFWSRVLMSAAVAEAGGMLIMMLAFVIPPFLPASIAGLLLSGVFILLAAWPSDSLIQHWEQELQGQGVRHKLR